MTQEVAASEESFPFGALCRMSALLLSSSFLGEMAGSHRRCVAHLCFLKSAILLIISATIQPDYYMITLETVVL